MEILITGGGGFLGSEIGRLLVVRGDSVRSYSRGRYLQLEKYGIRQFTGDLESREALEKAADGCDIIFHVAAKAGIWGPYEEYYRCNVEGTENVLRVCETLSIKKLVYTSSPSVVFAGDDQESIDESVPYPEKYLSHYSKTKAIAERLVMQSNSPTLATVSLRPHLIWGPNDNHLVPRIVSQARSGKLRKVGDWDKLVDSIYIQNAAEAHILAGDRLDVGGTIAGKTYFLSQGEPVSMAKLVNSILQAAGLPPVEKRISPDVAYAAGCCLEFLYRMFGIQQEPVMTRFLARQLSTSHWFNISAAKKELGYTPSVSLEQGFTLLEEWMGTKRGI